MSEKCLSQKNMRSTETFIGPCSKYIDKQGWTTEIPVKLLNEKGYYKVEHIENMLENAKLAEQIRYKTVVIPYENKEFLKAFIKALKKHYPKSPTIKKTINKVAKEFYTLLKEPK